MNLEAAFWTVFHRIFKWRPIVLGCCDCHGTYYVTKNKITRVFTDELGDSPVVGCPYCGLEHLMLLVRLTDNVVSVKYETVLEDVANISKSKRTNNP